jgi:hypothetical protein
MIADRDERSEDELHGFYPDRDRVDVGALLGLFDDSSTKLFHDPTGDAFITLEVEGSRQTHRVGSSAYTNLLTRQSWNSLNDVPAKTVLQHVAAIQCAEASFAPEQEVHVRVGRIADKTYLDLGDKTWRVVEINPDGYRLLDKSPIAFIRPSGLRALPDPIGGGNLDELSEVLNLDTDDLELVQVFVLDTLRPTGSHAVLYISGSAGWGKSTASRIVRSIVDPNGNPLRGEPREPRDLMIAASNEWIPTLDNLSSMPKAVADAICRLTTGAGTSYKKNYEDREEVQFAACRPVIMNGIDDLDNREDLRDRALRVECRHIPNKQRRTDADIERIFKAMHPRLLGALCEATSTALGRTEEVEHKGYALPRIADVAIHAEAAAPALGWEEGKAVKLLFDHAVAARQRDAISDPIAQGMIQFAKQQTFGPWEGTASELVAELAKLKVTVASASNLSSRLNRLAPALREQGVIIDRDRVGRAGRRIIRLRYSDADKVAVGADD